MQGKVVRVIAGFYDIKDKNNEYFRVRGSGNLRNNNFHPLVGDYVEFEKNGFLTKILERKNYFDRPKIANIDLAIIVISLKEPNFSSLLLDKFLMIVESKNVHPIVFLTKKDLLKPDDTETYDLYKKQNYEVYEIINNKTDFDFDSLKNIFKNKTCVFMGQSGVGKTSTINSLSGTNYETQTISKFLNRGKHTTRVVQIIEWNDGELIDTPGFSSIKIHLTPLQAAQSYSAFKNASKECKYKSCLHYNEKIEDCKVKILVQQNLISEQRYKNYVVLLKEILENKEELWTKNM